MPLHIKFRGMEECAYPSCYPCIRNRLNLTPISIEPLIRVKPRHDPRTFRGYYPRKVLLAAALMDLQLIPVEHFGEGLVRLGLIPIGDR
jgi:hypothetical protein